MIHIILYILIFCILIIANISVIQVLLFSTTGFKYDYKLLRLPAIISFLFWFYLLFTFKIVIVNILNINLITLFYYNNIYSIFSVYIIFVGFCMIGMFSQAISYMIINFNIKDSFGTAHLRIIDIFKKRPKNIEPNEVENHITNYFNVPHISFSTALTASLYTFIGFVCIIAVLLLMGIILGRHLLYMF